MTDDDLNLVDRHDEVVHAAMRAFASGGYGGTTLADIAAEAGVSQPRISQIFGNKEQAFIEAHKMASNVILAKLRRNAGKPFDPQIVGNGYTELIQNNREVLMMLFQSFASAYVTSIADDARRVLDEVISILVDDCGATYPEALAFISRGWSIHHALALDLGEHFEESDHFRGLLDALTGPIAVSPRQITRK